MAHGLDRPSHCCEWWVSIDGGEEHAIAIWKTAFDDGVTGWIQNEVGSGGPE